MLFLSSSLTPSFAQDASSTQAPSQPEPVQVQPDRSPQSDEARESDRKSSESVKVGRDWRAQQRDRDDDNPRNTGQSDTARTRNGRDMDRDHRTARVRPDDDRADRDGRGRSYFNEDRPSRRVKICFEYENGDEYCRYR